MVDETHGELPGGETPGEYATLVYDELRRLARGYFQQQRREHTLQPTALVHEAYLRLAERTRGAFESRSHFMATAALAMRQILVDHARRRGAARRGGDAERVALGDAAGTDGRTEVDLLELNDALMRLAELDERKAKVVELRLFAGLTIPEVGEAIGVSKMTVSTDWRMASAWLISELGAS